MKPILATIARARLTLQREELRQQVLARTPPRHTHPPTMSGEAAEQYYIPRPAKVKPPTINSSTGDPHGNPTL